MSPALPIVCREPGLFADGGEESFRRTRRRGQARLTAEQPLDFGEPDVEAEKSVDGRGSVGDLRTDDGGAHLVQPEKRIGEWRDVRHRLSFTAIGVFNH